MTKSLTENDIRPKSLDALRFEAQAKDIAWLLERNGEFVTVACPACGSQEGEITYRKHGFEWHRCVHCETRYMSPRPPVEILGEFYSRSELYKIWNDLIFPASQETRRLRIFRPRLEQMLALCEDHGVEGGSFFEIGAAHGIFCDEVRMSGKFGRVVAIEPSAIQAQTCRKLGLETIEAPVEATEYLAGTADVVAAFEVIEHLSNPGQFVAAMARLLRPGGLLLITTPNSGGFDIATLGPVSDQIYPEHVTLFSIDGLAGLVRSAGLVEVQRLTPGQLDCDIVRSKAIAGAIDLSDQPFLRRVLIEEWDGLGAAFQMFLANNGLSSHLWYVARRPKNEP